MIAKIAVLFAVVAIANAGVLVSPPASTTLLANHVAVAAPIAAVRTVAPVPVAHAIAAPVPVAHAIAAPVAYAAPATVVAAAPTVIQTGHKITTIHEPVEQHGYRIAY